MELKAWVTRQSAFSIQCGGIDRLIIHFTKPVYVLEKFTHSRRDSPFGDITEKEGGLYRRHGWIEPQMKSNIQPLSVGQWLGYANPVSDYIWLNLCLHFKDKPFEEWRDLELAGECKVEDFCLEITLNISIEL